MNLRDFVCVLRECESECAFDKELRENGLSRLDFMFICMEIREDERKVLRRKFLLDEFCEYFAQMLEKEDFEALAIKEKFCIEDNTKFEQMQENAALMQRLNEFYASQRCCWEWI